MTTAKKAPAKKAPAKKAPVVQAPVVQAPVKQLMRGISKMGKTSPELQESENIWMVGDVDRYLQELGEAGYDLINTFLVYATEKAYYIHYVI